jgi:hypothetical protein
MVDATDATETVGIGNCELVTVPAREGLEAAAILKLRDGVGPVLHDREGDTLGFVVPPGTAERWDVPGSACARAAVAQPPVMGGWLVDPEGAVAPATEPERLRAALDEATHMLAVVDRARASLRGA